MAAHFSTLAWKIPWTEEPAGLQSIASQESDVTDHAYAHFYLADHLEYTFITNHSTLAPQLIL